jgi:hypothetical protein
VEIVEQTDQLLVLGVDGGNADAIPIAPGHRFGCRTSVRSFYRRERHRFSHRQEGREF